LEENGCRTKCTFIPAEIQQFRVGGYSMLDEWLTVLTWLRYRLRAIQVKHWKRGKTILRELLALGASVDVAAQVAGNAKRWWHNSAMLLNMVLPIAYFDALGVPRLS